MRRLIILLFLSSATILPLYTVSSFTGIRSHLGRSLNKNSDITPTTSCTSYYYTTSSLSMSNSSNINNNNVVSTPISTKLPSAITFDNIENKNILVIGGSGRVGGSVVCNLLLHNAKVTVGGTNLESFISSKLRWSQLYQREFTIKNDDSTLNFVQVNREDVSSISKVLESQSYDLVIHTAGPFQGKVKTPNGVIEASIQHNVPYIDVCDDYCTAKAAITKYNAEAITNSVPCIVSTGCWPGVSSLMAKQLTTSVLKKHNNITPQDLTVDFSFFTAGSGGAGSTLLVATFLILAEKSLMIVNNRRKEVDAMKDYSKKNFGPVVGDKDVAHLNLLEAASIHDVLGIGNVKTLFGTAPGFWNALLGLMAQLPSSLLSNEPIMEKLALFSLPIVRVVDYFAGATNAMRCDVHCQKDPNIREMALYAHENLEPCVGECVVAFCAAILANKVRPGIQFPEQAIDAGEDVAAVLNLASCGAHTRLIESNSGLDGISMWGDV